ncbi:glycosyltransferase domain-containing protein [Vibrio sp. PNB22_2_2]
MKTCIYTAVFGDYDKINSIAQQTGISSYLVFSDRALDVPPPWEVVVVNDMKCYDNKDKNRQVKFFPMRFLSDFDCSLYIDGNILVKSDINIEDYMKYDFCAFEHPHRHCLKKELVELGYLGKLKKDDIVSGVQQVHNYMMLGYPNKIMIEANIIFRHHHKEVEYVMEKWWHEYEHGVKRDQISLCYVLWKYGKKLNIGILNSIDIRGGTKGEFYVCDHKSTLFTKVLLKIRRTIFGRRYWSKVVFGTDKQRR